MNLKLDKDGNFKSLTGEVHIQRMSDYKIVVVGKGLRLAISAVDVWDENMKLEVEIDEEPGAA